MNQMHFMLWNERFACDRITMDHRSFRYVSVKVQCTWVRRSQILIPNKCCRRTITIIVFFWCSNKSRENNWWNETKRTSIKCTKSTQKGGTKDLNRMKSYHIRDVVPLKWSNLMCLLSLHILHDLAFFLSLFAAVCLREFCKATMWPLTRCQCKFCFTFVTIQFFGWKPFADEL